VDLIGTTTLEQAFGALRASDGVIGYPSGLTIMATAFRKPTLMLWNQYFHEKFYWNACPPQARGSWYDALDTDHLEVDDVVSHFNDLVLPMYTEPTERVALPLQSFAPGQAAAPVPMVSLQSDAEKAQEAKQQRRYMAKHRQRLAEATTTSPDIVVACVLKSGGCYDARYVANLERQVRSHMHVPYRFVALTDCLDGEVDCVKLPLVHGWPGWWSKLELFNHEALGRPSRVIYFDLDTLILGDITRLATAPLYAKFYMIRGFRHPERRGSGVMVWAGNYSKLYDQFVKSAPHYLTKVGAIRPLGDQLFIKSAICRHYRQEPEPLQASLFPGLVSYKNDCLPHGGPPDGASIVCFHGTPRIHQVSDPWVREVWK
jgi:hypothetical protein